MRGEAGITTHAASLNESPSEKEGKWGGGAVCAQ